MSLSLCRKNMRRVGSWWWKPVVWLRAKASWCRSPWMRPKKRWKKSWCHGSQNILFSTKNTVKRCEKVWKGGMVERVKGDGTSYCGRLSKSSIWLLWSNNIASRRIDNWYIVSIPVDFMASRQYCPHEQGRSNWPRLPWQYCWWKKSCTTWDV